MAYDYSAGREYRARSHHPDHSGRTYVRIACPFCEAEMRASVWSLAGSGKKCPACGALHGSLGTAYPVMAEKKP